MDILNFYDKILNTIMVFNIFLIKDFYCFIRTLHESFIV